MRVLGALGVNMGANGTRCTTCSARKLARGTKRALGAPRVLEALGALGAPGVLCEIGAVGALGGERQEKE